MCSYILETVLDFLKYYNIKKNKERRRIYIYMYSISQCIHLCISNAYLCTYHFELCNFVNGKNLVRRSNRLLAYFIVQ